MPRHHGVRNFQAYVTVGGKGSGKTTLAMDDIDDYERMYRDKIALPMEPRILVHDYSDAFTELMTVEEFTYHVEKQVGKKIKREHPLDFLKWGDPDGLPVWKQGALRYVATGTRDIELFHQYVFDYVQNALVILDECSVYFRDNPPEWQRLLLVNHRNKGIELSLIFHKIMRVPKYLASSDIIHTYRILPTHENLKYQMLERYGCQDELFKAYMKVKKAPPKSTRTQHYETVIT